MRRMQTSIMRDIFYAAAMPKTLKRMAATPFARCPGQKSNLGTLKSPSASRWIMKLFRVKNTYAPRSGWRLTCVKSSFSRASSDWPGAIGREVQQQLNDFLVQIWIFFLGIPLRFTSKTQGGVNTTGFQNSSSQAVSYGSETFVKGFAGINFLRRGYSS